MHGQQFPSHGAPAGTDYVYLSNSTTGPMGKRSFSSFVDDIGTEGGFGTGDVKTVGAVTADRIAVYYDATGDKIKSGGHTIDQLRDRTTIANTRVAYSNGTHLVGDADLIFDGSILSTGSLYAANVVFAQGSGTPASGAGVILRSSGTLMTVDAYDFDGSAYKELRLRSDILSLHGNNGAQSAKFSGSNFCLGNSVSAGTSAVRAIVLQNGTKPTTYPHVHLYAAASELRVTDGGGNDTLLSPHSTDGPPELYDVPGLDRVQPSVNVFANRVEWINLSRLAKHVDLLCKRSNLKVSGCYFSESLQAYNERRGLVAGDADFQTPQDFVDHENQLASQRDAERQEWFAARSAFDNADQQYPELLRQWIAAEESKLRNWEDACEKCEQHNAAANEAFQTYHAERESWLGLDREKRNEIPEPTPPQIEFLALPARPKQSPPPPRPTWEFESAPPPEYVVRAKQPWMK